MKKVTRLISLVIGMLAVLSLFACEFGTPDGVATDSPDKKATEAPKSTQNSAEPTAAPDYSTEFEVLTGTWIKASETAASGEKITYNAETAEFVFESKATDGAVTGGKVVGIVKKGDGNFDFSVKAGSTGPEIKCSVKTVNPECVVFTNELLNSWNGTFYHEIPVTEFCQKFAGNWTCPDNNEFFNVVPENGKLNGGLWLSDCFQSGDIKEIKATDANTYVVTVYCPEIKNVIDGEEILFQKECTLTYRIESGDGFLKFFENNAEKGVYRKYAELQGDSPDYEFLEKLIFNL